VADRYLTFDCYGTLIDWESGIVRAVQEAAGELHLHLDREEILRLHREIEPKVQAESYRSYRQVLAETARRMFARRDVELSAVKASFLADTLPGWQPFRDTRPALERLRRTGYRLGILSNVDDALLSASLHRIGVQFDLLITAEQVCSYKPATAHFDAARRQIGEAAWTHVAESLFHDVAPATQLGIPVVWINRRREATPRPFANVPQYRDLASFADALLVQPAAG
jgi:2-haloalkanoic acid dehalogenase type II